MLALLVAAGGLYGAVSSGIFTAQRTVVSGATWTSEDAVLAALALPDGQNVFTLQTADLESRIEEIPSIQGASVSVALPDEIRVTVAEREPLVAWRAGGRTFLVDASGILFGEPGANPPAEGAGLPVIDDRRAGSQALDVGSSLDPVSLDAALRLASLTPDDVGSTADGMTIRVDDTNGFLVASRPTGWSAIFGFYTPTLRPPDVIPGQVRLLRALFQDPDVGEARVLRAILADEGSGTYVPRTRPSPSASPAP